VHDIALVDEPRPEAAIDRRTDVRVPEVDLGSVDLSFVTLDSGLQLRNLSLLLVVALPRLPSRGQKFFVALEIGLGADQVCLILLFRRLRLL
jgi:hypothetical protein